MLGIARIAMKSPFHAAALGFLSTVTLLFAWFGAAILALVVLRHGASKALPVLLACLLPSLYWMSQGDIGPLMSVIAITAMAQILRVRSGWSITISLTPFIFAAVTGFVLQFSPSYVDTLMATVTGLFEQTVTSMQQSGQADPNVIASMQTMKDNLDARQVFAVIAIIQSFVVICALAMARWWQSVIYNPEGFRAEFIEARLPQISTIGLLFAALALSSSEFYSMWVWVFLGPFMFAGISLFHNVAGKKQLKRHWFIAFYVSLLLFQPLGFVVMLLAMADSFFNIRERIV